MRLTVGLCLNLRPYLKPRQTLQLSLFPRAGSALARFISSQTDFPAPRWKAVALNDGSGLGRQELERLNSLLDKRIATLSAQLNKLNKISQV